MKPMVSNDCVFNYYADFLIYMDNVMVIHHGVKSVLRRIDKYIKLKPSSIGDPGIYLGAKINQMILENGV